ncbi:MAG: proteasome assembly chaperone family protein [Candidatus Bilamarchaeaceae archaeon]
MESTTIVELKKKGKLKNGVLIVGLPGIGLIGRVVARYLVKELKAEKVADLYSPHFPHQVLMGKKGGMRMIRNSFYVARGKKHDLLILLGDVQAITSVGQYEVSGKIVDFSHKCGVKEIISIGGYSTGKLSDNRAIYGVVTHKDMVAPLKKMGVEFGVTKGSIVGAAGLVPMLAKLRGTKGMCILGETHGAYVDATSAKNIVILLTKMLELKLDVKDLDKMAKEGEQIVKKLESEVQKNSIAPFDASKKDVSYIR